METARGVLDCIGGALVMPMTVLLERYWRKINRSGPTSTSRYGTSCTAKQETLRGRIEGEHAIPSPFRLQYLEPSGEADRTGELGTKA